MNYHVKNIFGKTEKKRVYVEVLGSKSITARALLIAALAKGETVLYNAQLSDDCSAFLECIRALGIECEVDGSTVKIRGCGGKLPVSEANINVRSAGTAARFLTALLALSEGEFTVDSSEQMKRRPIRPLIDSLVSVGASVTSENGTFPLKIRGAASPENFVEVDITESSQFLSALLISGVLVKNGITVRPVGSHGLDYVKMTLDMMWSFGVTVEERDGAYFVRGGYAAKKYDIEPDMSAACYFYAANRILGVDIAVKGVLPHSMQGDIKFIELIKNFNGGRIDMSEFSDQALTMAAVAPYFDNPTVISGVAHIRRQECDRIAAICRNLGAMGVRCEELPDGVKIYPSQPRPATIETFGDHRVAMAFALTGLRADGIVISNAEVCSKTFSDYFEVLDGVIEKIT